MVKECTVLSVLGLPWFVKGFEVGWVWVSTVARGAAPGGVKVKMCALACRKIHLNLFWTNGRCSVGRSAQVKPLLVSGVSPPRSSTADVGEHRCLQK